MFRGTLANSAGLAVTIGDGSTLDVQNLGTVELGSLSAGSGSSLGVSIGETSHTLYNVAGSASFGSGSTRSSSPSTTSETAAGTYTILDAGTLTGAENLTSSIITLPFLFNSKLSSDASTGQVMLEIDRKDLGALGLNRSETSILDAALDAADSDKAFSAVFLNVADSATLKATLQQLMPDYAGGTFEAATKGSRLAAGILSDPRPISGLWLQQVAWGSSKSIGDTSSYDVTGWGVTGGYDVSLGNFASVGVTAAYLWSNDGHLANTLMSNHYEGGAYLRVGGGPLRAWARATAGLINFESKRNFNSTVTGQTVSPSPTVRGKATSILELQAFPTRRGRGDQHSSERLDRILQADRGWLHRNRWRRRFRPGVDSRDERRDCRQCARRAWL